MVHDQTVGSGNRSTYTNGEKLQRLEIGLASDVPVFTALGTELPTARSSWLFFDDLIAKADSGQPVVPEQYLRRIVPHPVTGCWLWNGYLHPADYGYMAKPSGDYSHTAHKAIYQLINGLEAVDAEQHLDHLCRNRRCCNPWHLEPVSGSENMRRINPASIVEHQVARRLLSSELRDRLTLNPGSVLTTKLGITTLSADGEIRHEDWDKTSGPQKLLLFQFSYPWPHETHNLRASVLPVYSMLIEAFLPPAADSARLFQDELAKHSAQGNLFDQTIPLAKVILDDISLNPLTGCWQSPKYPRVKYSNDRTVTTCMTGGCYCPFHRQVVGPDYKALAAQEVARRTIELHGETSQSFLLFDLPDFSTEDSIILTARGPVFSRDL